MKHGQVFCRKKQGDEKQKSENLLDCIAYSRQLLNAG